MKSTLLLTLIFLLGNTVRAQQKITVDVGQKPMSKGLQMAVSVFIPEAKIKGTIPLWEKYVNDRSLGERLGNLTTQVGNIFRSEENRVNRNSLKVQKKGDEYYVRALQELTFTSHPVDVYANLVETSEGCLVNAFFQYTDSVFMNESTIDQERIENIKSYMHDFGVVASQNVVDNQIKAAKKDLSEQEKVAKRIESSTKKAEKSISGYETDIQEHEAGILDVQNDMKRLDEKITAQKLTFSLLTKESPDYDVAKSGLKELTREKSKSYGKIKSLKGKIKAREMDIKSAKRKISKNEQKVDEQQKVIDEKEQIVDQLEQKKNAIQ